MSNRLTDDDIAEMRDRAGEVHDTWWKFIGDNANDLYTMIDKDIFRLLDEVERLRCQIDILHDHRESQQDTVRHVAAERDRYREALKEIRDTSDLDYDGEQGFMACDMKTIARQTLEDADG